MFFALSHEVRVEYCRATLINLFNIKDLSNLDVLKRGLEAHLLGLDQAKRYSHALSTCIIVNTANLHSCCYSVSIAISFVPMVAIISVYFNLCFEFWADFGACTPIDRDVIKHYFY